MKKFLACTVATIIAASMMTACGDSSDDSSSSKAETTPTTTAAPEESEAESEAEESEAESAAEESEAESEGDESAADGEEAVEPKPISEMPATLQDLETASLVFDTSMDPADFVKCMAENDWEGTDESHCEFSIEEVEGVPMLRVQVLDKVDVEGGNWKIPKIQFDVSKIFGGDAEKIGSIFTIDIEFMTKAVGPFTADDGTESMVPGNFMGSLVSQPGSDPEKLDWKELDSQIAESEWTSEWGTYKFTVRPGLLGPYEAVDTTQYFTFMRWGIPNQQDFYIADITFKDENNNVIATAIGPHAE